MNEQQGLLQFLHCIAREQAMTKNCTHYDGVNVHPEDKSQPSQGCKGQLQGYGDDGPPCNNQIFHMLSIKMMTANKLILQEATMMSISSMLYHKRSNNSYIFVVARGRGIAMSLQ
jgi:hypothetical protein